VIESRNIDDIGEGTVDVNRGNDTDSIVSLYQSISKLYYQPPLEEKIEPIVDASIFVESGEKALTDSAAVDEELPVRQVNFVSGNTMATTDIQEDSFDEKIPSENDIENVVSDRDVAVTSSDVNLDDNNSDLSSIENMPQIRTDSYDELSNVAIEEEIITSGVVASMSAYTERSAFGLLKYRLFNDQLENQNALKPVDKDKDPNYGNRNEDSIVTNLPPSSSFYTERTAFGLLQWRLQENQRSRQQREQRQEGSKTVVVELNKELPVAETATSTEEQLESVPIKVNDTLPAIQGDTATVPNLSPSKKTSKRGRKVINKNIQGSSTLSSTTKETSSSDETWFKRNKGKRIAKNKKPKQ
jgi:hypothetical protein